jgi:hypothetical protein
MIRSIKRKRKMKENKKFNDRVMSPEQYSKKKSDERNKRKSKGKKKKK